MSAYLELIVVLNILLPNQSFVAYLIAAIIIVFTTVVLSSLSIKYIITEAYAVTTNSEINSTTPVRHVIIVSQGERSFDNYFGTFPGANGIPKNVFFPVDPSTRGSMNFTVAVWFNTNHTFSNKAFLVNKGGLGVETKGRNMNYGIWMNPNGNMFTGFENSNGTDRFIGSAVKYNDGRWHHVAVTYDGNCSLVLYVDGIEQASNQSCLGAPDIGSTNPIRIGSNSAYLANFFTGFIDELTIWNRTLSPSEIENAYDSNILSMDGQIMHSAFKEGNNYGSEFENPSVQLHGLYLNGSTYKDVFSANTETIDLEPFNLNVTKTSKPQRDSELYRISYNYGQMNGFAFSQFLKKNDPELVLGYYDKNELPYYWNFASEFVLADRFFTPTMKSGLINELYQYMASPGQNIKNASSTAVSNISRSVFDSLEENKLPWKVYVENYDQLLKPKDTKKEKQSYPFNLLSRLFGNVTLNPNIVDLSQYLADLKSDSFPAVAYIIAPSYHETAPKDMLIGQEFVSALVLALMKSKHWDDSAFIVTYRESGGWYDHVRPPAVDEQRYGFRVPTLIISPFAKKGFIDSTQYDATSILKFIEYNYGLKKLGNWNANTSNLLNAFNFTNLPRDPLYIEEISRNRLIVTSSDVIGINALYIFGIAVPILVTITWYYIFHNSKKQKVKSK